MPESSREITVVTSITGGKDHLIEGQNKGDARFVAFLEETQYSQDWEIQKAYDKFKSPRRNSRIHKIQIHQFVNTEYSLWLDGNLRLLVPPEQLVSEWLDGYDIAVFKHPDRECLYDEAMVCAKFQLDDQEEIISQAVRYENAGFGKGRGLGECNMILRRNTEKVERFNNYWWSEHCRGCVRDQVSFMYALDKAGLRCNFISPSARAGHPYFKFIDHLTPRPE